MKKVSGILAILCAMSIALTACGTSPSDNSKAASGNSNDSAATQNVKLRFMWWGGDARHEATMKVISSYTAAHPNVTIDAEYGGMDGYYQKLTTQLSSGTEPDIMQLVPEWFTPLGRSGDVFYQLDTDKIIDTSGFDQSYLKSSCSIKDKLQGLPTGGNGSIMAVNQNFMKKYGIAADTKWDWATLKSKGAEIHAQDPKAYLVGAYVDGASPAITHLLKYYVMQQDGATGWVNKDFTLGFTEDQLVKGFKYFQDLLAVGAMQPVAETSLYKSPSENPNWLAGNVGMIHAMPSTLSLFKADGIDLDVIACPKDANAKDSGVVSGPPQYITISNKSKNAKEAEKFVNYFFNDKEAITTLGTVRGPQPTTGATKILKEANLISTLDAKAMQVVTDSASKNFNLNWLGADFETPYNDACNSVLFGTATPEQAAKKMISEYKTACDTLKSAS